MAYTPVPTINDGDFLTEDWTLPVEAAIEELQTEVPQGTIAKLNALGSVGEEGADSVGPTSGATVLTVNTISVPDPVVVAGRIHAWGQMNFTQTVSTDIFQVALTIAGNQVGATRTDNVPAGTNHTLLVSGSANVNPGAGIGVSLTLVRISGTGTATVSVTVGTNLHAFLIPTV